MSEYLPTDLILKIISRLPSKSVARCRCLSKLWASLLALGSPYFTELFLTQSKTRPRLLFAVRKKNLNKWLLYSCPQPQISSTNSSLSVTAEFHMFLYGFRDFKMSALVSGLLYFPNITDYNRPTLCNPTTRNRFRLPQPVTEVQSSFFGYNPINQHFSILAISNLRPLKQGLSSIYQILKLGTEKLSWRNIECPLHHSPLKINICINGILYYIANFDGMFPCKMVCFDLNLEEFKFIDVPWSREPKILVNFKGKLGGIDTNGVEFDEERCNLDLILWVFEDVKKQEWSKHVYRFPAKLWNTKLLDISIVGVTVTGEVMLYLWYTTNPLYVYLFNFEKNILQKVEIKGFEEFKIGSLLYANVNYVEDLKNLSWN